MERLTAAGQAAPQRPVKVLQFGEGNFLRAFVDYMIDIANEKTDFNGGIVLVKPISFGNLEAFHQQDCRYTVMLRGLVDGNPTEQSRLITSVNDAVDAYGEYEKYAAYAKEESLRFIVSNTTEAGIVLDESDEFSLCPPKSYPGKLCKLLFERAEAFDYANDKGLKEMIADFEDMSFWELLAYRLAQRDVEKKVKGMSNEIAYNAISERIDEYSDEFFENDLKNVYVKGMNALKGDLKGIRSMIAGDLPTGDNDDY